jgi:hypothetical protein
MSSFKHIVVTSIAGSLVGFGAGAVAITRPSLPVLTDIELLTILFFSLTICLALLVLSIIKTLRPAKKKETFYLPRLKIGYVN